MKKVFAFILAHPWRALFTLGLLMLAYHWGMLGLVLLSVPIFAIWESVLP